MILNVNVKNVMFDNTSKTKIDLDDNATISDLLSAIGGGTAEFPECYLFSSKLMFGEPYLPFVFSENRILYDVPFAEAKVSDFISTMNLSDKEVEISIGIPWAGGPGLCDLEQMWESAKLALEAIAVFCSITGITVTSIIKWFCNLFKKRKKKPQTIFDIIYSRKMWNHHELALLLDIDPNNAKEMLRLFGYRYDNRKKIYIEREDIEEIKSKLLEVKGLDIQ